MPATHVFFGETVTLRCGIWTAVGSLWIYHWYKNNNKLSDQKKQEITIGFVGYADGGDYSCSGQDVTSKISEISDVVTMIVSAKPKPTVRVNTQSSIYTGDTITLSCELQSTGWEFLWFCNNKQLLLNNKKANTLLVTVDIAEERMYKCFARRGFTPRGFTRRGLGSLLNYYETNHSDPVKIGVKECFIGNPIAEVSIMPDTHVFIGETVTLRCEIWGKAVSLWIYSWYKNNNKLTDQINQEITIEFVVYDDGGEYSCSGQDGIFQKSEISDVVTLIVSECFIGNPIAEVSIMPDTHVFIGETVTLRCEIWGEAASLWIYSWYKNNNKLTELLNQEITIGFVEYDDGGDYSCSGQDGIFQKSEISDVVTLIVSEIPKPVASINPDKLVFSGDTVTLRCEIQDESVSRWQYSWYKDASLSPVSSVQMYTISSVEVTHTARPEAVATINPDKQVFSGDTVTLRCEIQDESVESPFSHILCSNPQPIWISDGDVILESSVHPVTEGHPLTLHCLYRNTNPSNL
ncbi:Fc receptor-like protein 5 [Silurus meridionalis]|nr:Fc receptor-like protein 5 [Silurus meridionalis]